MSKKLVELLKAIDGTIHNATNEYLNSTPIENITFDSGKVTKSDIFVAIKGLHSDGHTYIPDAVNNGAALVVLENKQHAPSIPYILVENTRQALALLANEFYNDRSADMKIVGITGTNGKTTTNWILYHLLNQIQTPCIRFGTLGREGCNKNGDRILLEPDTLTTADPVYLSKSLDLAYKSGITSAVMEVSSHALTQHRVDGINFDVAVFTNLTQDHLDYHSTFEDYYQAKLTLFKILSLSAKPLKTAVINTNSEYGKRLHTDISNLGLYIITFGDSEHSNIQVKSIKQSIEGSTIEYNIYSKTYQIKTQFIGHHNAENIAAAIGSCLGLGFSIQEIMDALPKIPQVPGRLESCGNEKFGIYIDYAHTPDALENVLQAVKPIVKNKLWVIFGCGGDRDKTKRPKMLEACQKLADKIVVTSDNPRTENPDQIIKDILHAGGSPELVEVDRKVAIKKTLDLLDEGDALIIAGKGHENYQIIGKTKHHYSDLEEVERNLTQK